MTSVYEHHSICDFKQGDRIKDIYLLQSLSERKGRTGSLYYAVSLQDASGTISGNLWEKPENIDKLKEGIFVMASFVVKLYNDRLQMKFESLVPFERNVPHEYLHFFIPTAPEDPQKMYAELWRTADSFHDEDYKAVVEKVLHDNKGILMTLPAAQKVHENGIGGLLQHLTSMLKIAEGLVNAYPDKINAELLYAGVILHDIGKIREFETGRYGLVTGYTNEGNLEGHLFIGAEYVGKVCDELHVDGEKKMLLQHMLLSHHGKPEYGACVEPKFLEAFLLFICDYTDSRFWIYEDAYRTLKPGESAKDTNFYLDGIRVYRPKE